MYVCWGGASHSTPLACPPPPRLSPPRPRTAPRPPPERHHGCLQELPAAVWNDTSADDDYAQVRGRRPCQPPAAPAPPHPAHPDRCRLLFTRTPASHARPNGPHRTTSSTPSARPRRRRGRAWSECSGHFRCWRRTACTPSAWGAMRAATTSRPTTTEPSHRSAGGRGACERGCTRVDGGQRRGQVHPPRQDPGAAVVARRNMGGRRRGSGVRRC